MNKEPVKTRYPKLRIFWKSLFTLSAAILSVAVLGATFLIRTSPVIAQVILDPVTTVTPMDSAPLTVADIPDIGYVEPTNTFSDGNPTYYLVTQDPAKAGLTSLSYNGVNCTLVGVVANETELMRMKVGTPPTSIFAPNTTIFFDDGTYTIDSQLASYTLYSKTNLSLVGLNYGQAIIKSLPYMSGNAEIIGTIERNQIHEPNVYIENLIFDGDGNDMYPLGPSTGVGKNRGEYFFMIGGGYPAYPDNTGSEGLVMRNVTIQNVGSSNVNRAGFFTTWKDRKNVGMNFYRSTGQHNFENLTFKNIKTTNTIGSFPGYGILSFNQTNGNYFKNITIDGVGSHSLSESIKVEHMETIHGVDLQNNWGVFTGTITLPGDANHNHFYIQDFAYDQVRVPTEYRYAMYRLNNGTRFSSAIQVYKNIPTVSTDYAVLDLWDNAWVVRDNGTTSINSQLDVIRRAMAASGADSPKPNIKIVASGGFVNGFTVPDYSTTPYSTENVNIIAVPDVTTLMTSRELVPFVADGVITLNPANAARERLINFDFDALAKYTTHEAISGIDPTTVTLTDPNEATQPAGYPIFSSYQTTTTPRIVNSTINTFMNDRFTSLTHEIALMNPIADLAIGASTDLNPALSGSPRDSYTATGTTIAMTRTANDQAIHCYSSDPAVATVDLTTCRVTAITEGTVTITAKAIDAYNQGEIEKPWVQITFNVLPNAQSTPLPTQPTQPSLFKPFPSMDGVILPETGYPVKNR